MARYKIGTFVDLNFHIVTIVTENYDYELRKSIIQLLTWFNENILIYPTLGIQLRKRLSDGISFDERTLRYLINSFQYWRRESQTKIKFIRRHSYYSKKY